MKLKVSLIITISIASILGLLMMLAPLSTQQLIASWLETAYQEYLAPSDANQIKLLGPASSRSNLVK